MPAVSDCNIIRELTPHWFHANSSRAHKNRARVSRPFLPRAGDAMHPALWKREGLGMRLHVNLLISHQTSNNTGRHLIAIGLNWGWATNNQRDSWDNEILVSKFSLVTGLCHNTNLYMYLTSWLKHNDGTTQKLSFIVTFRNSLIWQLGLVHLTVDPLANIIRKSVTNVPRQKSHHRLVLCAVIPQETKVHDNSKDAHSQGQSKLLSWSIFGRVYSVCIIHPEFVSLALEKWNGIVFLRLVSCRASWCLFMWCTIDCSGLWWDCVQKLVLGWQDIQDPHDPEMVVWLSLHTDSAHVEVEAPQLTVHLRNEWLRNIANAYSKLNHDVHKEER